MNASMLGVVEFPRATGININMMPFIMGDHGTLPAWVRQHAPIIDRCPVGDEAGKVGYLSISEGFVRAGGTQRRPGLHCEGHPRAAWGGGGWGGRRGLYMASNIEGSCAVWDARVKSPGPGGDCEHMRGSLGERSLMGAGQLWWLHDRTPHEALPVNINVHRQWFRLVTSDVSIWYAKHSTVNPLGVRAACREIHTDKFMGEG